MWVYMGVRLSALRVGSSAGVGGVSGVGVGAW